MLNQVSPASVAQALEQACIAEVRALKPGNVSVHSEGHGMTVAQFEASAKAISAPLSHPASSVGERILRAVQATREAVGCNTNLGIVLLCAPIAQAALQARGLLHERVRAVLQTLTLQDAELTFRAIVIANPGGLGKTSRHDVREPPRVNLLEAMRARMRRDLIARQYANGFYDIFTLGVPRARQVAARWASEEWTTAAIYLAYLARFPDTHIARKYGRRAAAEVRDEARKFDRELAQQDNPSVMAASLLDWDRRLKQSGYNPGTCADLTVATLFALRVQALLVSCPVSSGSHGSALNRLAKVGREGLISSLARFEDHRTVVRLFNHNEE